VSGRINDIDVCALVLDGTVLGENRNATLFLKIVRIHDSLGHPLVRPESSGLTQKLIDQCGFAVVNVGNNRNVTQCA
jgi:hypothetical protein